MNCRHFSRGIFLAHFITHVITALFSNYAKYFKVTIDVVVLCACASPTQRIMATGAAGGPSGRRRKRPWRQPRHEAGHPPLSTASPPIAGSIPGRPSAVEDLAETKRAETEDATRVSEPSEAGRDQRSPKSMVEIDGSIMEGVGRQLPASHYIHSNFRLIFQGGQILRNTVALSCLVQRPVRVTKVRGGRSKPGLRPQHLAGLHLIGRLCGGKLAGDRPNSTKVEFWPGSIRNGDYSADTQTAG